MACFHPFEWNRCGLVIYWPGKINSLQLAPRWYKYDNIYSIGFAHYLYMSAILFSLFFTIMFVYPLDLLLPSCFKIWISFSLKWSINSITNSEYMPCLQHQSQVIYFQTLSAIFSWVWLMVWIITLLNIWNKCTLFSKIYGIIVNYSNTKVKRPFSFIFTRNINP